MYRKLADWFRKAETPSQPFEDAVLGQFEFEQNLGWKKRIRLADREADLVLGSDGGPPTGKTLQMAKSWVEAWPSQHPKIIAYIHAQLRDWSEEPNLPVPEKLEVESINFLWRDKPATCMIEFHHPGDDNRVWHVTFDEFEPEGFAFDD